MSESIRESTTFTFLAWTRPSIACHGDEAVVRATRIACLLGLVLASLWGVGCTGSAGSSAEVIDDDRGGSGDNGGDGSSTTVDLAEGQVVYDTNCQACHGESGRGDGPIAAALDPRPRDFSRDEFRFDTNDDGRTGTDRDLRDVIVQGAGPFGGSHMMAPWPALSRDEVDNIIGYIRTF